MWVWGLHRRQCKQAVQALHTHCCVVYCWSTQTKQHSSRPALSLAVCMLPLSLRSAAPADGFADVALCVPRHAGGAWYLAPGGHPQVAAACHAVHLAGAAAKTIPRHRHLQCSRVHGQVSRGTWAAYRAAPKPQCQPSLRNALAAMAACCNLLKSSSCCCTCVCSPRCTGAMSAAT